MGARTSRASTPSPVNPHPDTSQTSGTSPAQERRVWGGVDLEGPSQVALKIREEIDHWKQVSETAARKKHRREFDEQAGKRLIQPRELQEMLNQTEMDDKEARQEIKHFEVVGRVGDSEQDVGHG